MKFLLVRHINIWKYLFTNYLNNVSLILFKKYAEDGRKIQLSLGIKLDVSNTSKYENEIPTEL